MNTPSFLALLRALSISNLISSVPSMVMSLTSHSWGPFLSYLGVVQSIGLIIGIPACYFLFATGIFNAVSSTVTGALVGALSLAISMSNMSGPGVHYGETVFFGTIGGTAVGFLFWLYLQKFGHLDEEDLAEEASDERFQPPTSRKPLASSTRQPPQKTEQPPRPPLRPEDEALFRAIEEKKKADPLVGAKLGGKEVFDRLMSSMKSDRGVHTESLISALGSLAGYSCQASLRAQALASGKPETAVLLTAEGADGRKYFFGDPLNQALAESKYSIWALAAGAAQHNGSTTLPKIHDIFEHVTQTVGTDSFGVPRFPEGHNAGDLPINYLKALWPALLPVVKLFCKNPQEWPLLFGFAIQEAIDAGKQVVSPDVALQIVMEAAIPMSKVDLTAA